VPSAAAAPATPIVFDVPRVGVEHFGYGTVRIALDIWPPDDFPEMGVLGELWARAMGGDDPVPVPASSILALDKAAGLIFGFYAHPYRLPRNDKRAKRLFEKEPKCEFCLAVWALIEEARALKKAGLVQYKPG
jgi:hypothetical protein